VWFCFVIQVQQHDHIQEQHHDGSGVDDYMSDKQELRIQQQVVTRNCEECKNEVEHTMHRVPGEHHHQCTKHRDE
jgi:hypothetical protein